MTTTEELLGLIKGLGEAVKGHLKAHSKSQAELQQLTAAVGNLVEISSNSHSESVPQDSSSVSRSLRLPQVTLPVYKGRPNANLNRFTNTLTSLLKSSGVPSCHWTTYLKQEDVPYSLTLVTTSLYIGNHVQKPLVLLQSGFHVGKDRVKLQNVYLIQTTTALNTLTREKYLIQRMSTN